MAVHLVCEGSTSGLDNRVLNRLVIQFHNLEVLLVPSGSSSGHGSIRAFLQNRGDVVISVEDRDYTCSRPEADSSWANPKAPRFRWRRHEIENYLLEPQVVLALFNDYRKSAKQWTPALPDTEADVLNLLQKIAASLLENHVGEVIRVELLRQSSPPGGNLQYGPRRPSPAGGQAVPGHPEWIPALQQEATRLCNACVIVAALPALQPAAIEARYHALLTELQANDFLRSADFLIEMGGHELMKALAAELRLRGAPPEFTDGKLEDDLLDALASIYQPQVTFQPDDFHDLAQILRKH